MCEQEKKQQRIYDLPKKISKIIGISLWLPGSSGINPLDYAIWGILENKTNATSHSIIVLLKTTLIEEWNKMCEEFILKVCNSFQWCVDRISEKIGGHIE